MNSSLVGCRSQPRSGTRALRAITRRTPEPHRVVEVPARTGACNGICEGSAVPRCWVVVRAAVELAAHSTWPEAARVEHSRDSRRVRRLEEDHGTRDREVQDWRGDQPGTDNRAAPYAVLRKGTGQRPMVLTGWVFGLGIVTQGPLSTSWGRSVSPVVEAVSDLARGLGLLADVIPKACAEQLLRPVRHSIAAPLPGLLREARFGSADADAYRRPGGAGRYGDV
jgi:hypothetical protein